MKLYATITSEKGGSDAKKGGDEIVQVYLYRGNKKVGYVMLTQENIAFTEYPQEGKKQKGECLQHDYDTEVLPNGKRQCLTCRFQK